MNENDGTDESNDEQGFSIRPQRERRLPVRFENGAMKSKKTTRANTNDCFERMICFKSVS